MLCASLEVCPFSQQIDCSPSFTGTHTFFTIYRNRKLFYGQKSYGSLDSDTAWFDISKPNDSPYASQDDSFTVSICEKTLRLETSFSDTRASV